MKEILTQTVYFGVVLTLICYLFAAKLRQKWNYAIINPNLISMILIIGVLLLFDTDYATYSMGAKYIDYFLTPATISLAVPLYRQLKLLREYPKAIFLGIAAGVLTAMVSITLMGMAFGLDEKMLVTLLPKSITTAIGIGISEKMGGMVTLTVIAIMITGIFGNVCAKWVLKIAKIEEPIAKGLAIGTSAHALGTTKAMELGEAEGAMSSLSIVVAGIMTVIAVPIFAMIP